MLFGFTDNQNQNIFTILFDKFLDFTNKKYYQIEFNKKTPKVFTISITFQRLH